MAVIIATTGILVVSTDDASAQNAQCRRIKAEISRLEAGGGANPNYVNWNRKADEQRRAIRAAERQYRAGRCHRANSSQQAQCSSLNNTLSRMKANLGKLERRRDRYSSGGQDNSRRIRALRNKLNGLNCGRSANARIARNDTGDRASRGPREGNRPRNGRRSRQGGLLGMLFGQQPGPREARNTPRDYYSRRRQRLQRSRWQGGDDGGPDFYDPFGGSFFSGTYRTLCVRRCDGYYFPISFSTTQELFGRDQHICSSMCPAGDAELYVHENPGGTPEHMTTVDGRSYAEMPKAFSYRRKFDKNCTCRSAHTRITTLSRLHLSNGRLLTRDTKSAAANVPASALKSAPVPMPPRPRDLDPDSLLNEIGNFQLPRRVVPKKGDTQYARSDKGVRIVGPKFFYAQQ